MPHKTNSLPINVVPTYFSSMSWFFFISCFTGRYASLLNASILSLSQFSNSTSVGSLILLKVKQILPICHETLKVIYTLLVKVYQSWTNHKRSWGDQVSQCSYWWYSNIYSIKVLLSSFPICFPLIIFYMYAWQIQDFWQNIYLSHDVLYPTLSFENNFFQLGFTPYKAETATTRHWVAGKRNTKRSKQTGILFRKNLQLIGVC